MENYGRFQSIIFFRTKLLTLTSHSEVEEFLTELESDQAKIIEHISELVWVMRGGVPYDQAWQLSSKERQIMMKQGEMRMKATKESKLALM